MYFNPDNLVPLFFWLSVGDISAFGKVSLRLRDARPKRIK
jgi:hypothetical protein